MSRLPPQFGPPETNGWSGVFKRPLVIAVISVSATLAVCAGVGLLIYLGYQSWTVPEQVDVSFVYPTHVKLGDSFDIEVRIKNLSNRPRVLDSVDVYDDFLAGILVETSTPRWRGSSHLYGQFVTYDFQIEIPPNAEIAIKFHGRALRQGDFMGNWDACIDGPASCVTEVVRTIVSREGS